MNNWKKKPTSWEIEINVEYMIMASASIILTANKWTNLHRIFIYEFKTEADLKLGVQPGMLMFPTLLVVYGTHQYLIASIWKTRDDGV